MKKIIIAFTSVTALFFTSCASIVSKSTYPVTFTSSQSGVSVKVTDSNTGTLVHSATAPTTASLKSGSGFSAKSYTVQAIKGGKVIGSKSMTASMDGWVVGNIVFGGLIGLVIDGATGAMYALPQNFSVATSSSVQILDFNALTVEQKSALIKL